MTNTVTPDQATTFSSSRQARSSRNSASEVPLSFPRPKPNFAFMALLAQANRWVMLKRRFRISDIDLPSADRERLARATHPDNATFVAPNHPEFGLDWMLDKEISRLVAPRMAAWAAHEIIAAAPWFWTRNNLVSNRGRGAALEYSIDWALKGSVVLLHPEGMVRWTSDTVHPLFAGIAEMSVSAAQRSAAAGLGRITFVAPVVWKARYTHDVSDGILAEITYIEHALGVERGTGANVAERFRHLNESVLARQIARFGFTPGSSHSQDYFERQDDFRRWLVDDLLSRYDIEPSESLDQLIHRLGRVATGDDRARQREAARLGGFARAWYDSPTLTQEQIHESLKRVRADLVRGGVANRIHNMLPKPYGPRMVHMRVPGPILVSAPMADAGRPDCVAELLVELRRSMQRTLDALNREIAPLVDPLRHPNLLHVA